MAKAKKKAAARCKSTASPAHITVEVAKYQRGGKELELYQAMEKPVSPEVSAACGKELDNVKKTCKGDATAQCKDEDCQKARKCVLMSYKEGTKGGCCGEYKTPHHLVEVHCFGSPDPKLKSRNRKKNIPVPKCGGYDLDEAPCVCVKETTRIGEHGDLHAVQNVCEVACMTDTGQNVVGGGNGEWTYEAARTAGVLAMTMVFKKAGPGGKPFSKACIAAQLDEYHVKTLGIPPGTKLRAYSGSGKMDEEGAEETETDRALKTEKGRAKVTQNFKAELTRVRKA